jgi:RHS repeat-associated protein
MSNPNSDFDEKKLKQLQLADVKQLAEKVDRKKVVFREYKPFTYEEIEQKLKEEDDDKPKEMQQRAPEMAPLYFYHPDHLGTSTALTDFNGEAYQFFLNLPFGETMVEQLGNNYFNTPYKFNGKELDEETGLYYYGARYYDPRISVWYSVDPLAEHAPDKTPYHYCSNNPINRIDPTGMCDDPNCEHGALRRGWDAVGRFFGLWGHGKKQATSNGYTITAGPLETSGQQTAGAPVLPFPPEVPMTVIRGGAAEGVAAAGTMSLLSAGTLIGAGLLVSGDSRPKEDKKDGLYLYRNMRRGLGGIGVFPELGSSANTLGLRPQDVNYLPLSTILSSDFDNGLSTTMGNKNTPFGMVPNEGKNTTLFKLDVRSLGAFGLKLTPKGPSYGRITPGRTMTVEEFNSAIQATEGLWKQN